MTESKLCILPAKTVEWSTPQWLFDVLDSEFHFTVDVAATAENAKCERYYDKALNGLLGDWTGERVFCNPPFGVKDLTAFSGKAYRTSCIAVLIVPVKCDQQWWADYAIRSEIRSERSVLPVRLTSAKALLRSSSRFS